MLINVVKLNRVKTTLILVDVINGIVAHKVSLPILSKRSCTWRKDAQNWKLKSAPLFGAHDRHCCNHRDHHIKCVHHLHQKNLHIYRHSLKGGLGDRLELLLQYLSDFCHISCSINKHQLASISINQYQHQSASTSIGINQYQHQSASISINQHQSASISINRHQSA